MMARSLYAALIACLVVPGCVSHEFPELRPAPRPLGRDLPSYQAPSEPSMRPVAEMPAEPKGPLTLRQALSLALMRNPELAVFSWEIRAKEAERLQASLLPNPEIGVGSDYVGGSFSGFRESENSAVLSQLIELGGKRAKRTRLAGLESDLAAWDYETKRMDVFTQVAKAYVGVLGAQQRLKVAQETVRIAEELFMTSCARVEAGVCSMLERIRAEAELAVARIGLEKATQEVAAARKRLAATWGSTEPRFTDVLGELEIELIPPPISLLVRRLSQNPDLARWAAELEQRRAVVALEKAKAIPDLTLGAGYLYLAEDDADSMAFLLSMPLPIFNRNPGGILAARSRLVEAEEGRRAAKVRLWAELAEAYAALQATSREVKSLKDEVLPRTLEALEGISEGFRRGKFSYIEVLDAQRTLAQTRARYVDALVSLQEAKADVERLVGEPLEAFPGVSESVEGGG